MLTAKQGALFQKSTKQLSANFDDKKYITEANNKTGAVGVWWGV
jgi:hypothetical protein